MSKQADQERAIPPHTLHCPCNETLQMGVDAVLILSKNQSKLLKQTYRQAMKDAAEEADKVAVALIATYGPHSIAVTGARGLARRLERM